MPEESTKTQDSRNAAIALMESAELTAVERSAPDGELCPDPELGSAAPDPQARIQQFHLVDPPERHSLVLALALVLALLAFQKHQM
jgi:hypothetical protein